MSGLNFGWFLMQNVTVLLSYVYLSQSRYTDVQNLTVFSRPPVYVLYSTFNWTVMLFTIVGGMDNYAREANL